MVRSDADWNFDRIHTAQAQIASAQDEMMRILHKGEAVDIVRDRMVRLLRDAAGDLEKIKLNHD